MNLRLLYKYLNKGILMKKLPAQSVTYLPELLKYVNDEPDYENQKALVIQYVSKDSLHANVIQSFVELMWHPAINWELPEGNPPYTPASSYVGESPGSLFKVLKNMNRFLTGGENFLHDNNRRELFWVMTLESLSKDEGELLCQIKNKKLTSYPNISLKLFAELFPQYLPEEVVKNANFLPQPVKINLSLSDTVSVESNVIVKKSAGRPKKSTK
jgi:hypothetical protein